MLKFRRTLGILCYLISIAANTVSGYVIYLAVSGKITYYLGMLIFVPVFILSYWFATFFMQLTEGRHRGKRIMPKWLRGFLNGISTLLSLALVVFWGYICITQQMNQAAIEGLIEQSVRMISMFKMK